MRGSQREKIRVHVLLLGLIAAILICACTKKIEAPPSALEPEPSRLLIKHGWDMPDVQYVAKNAALLDAAPFHGVMISSPLRDAVFSRRLLTSDEIAQVLTPYKNTKFSKKRYDFLLLFANHPVSATNPPGIFEDWTVVFENLRRVAKAAHNAGFYGIAFDNEPYFHNWFGWKSGIENCDLFVEYVAQYKKRGRELMAVLEESWPESHFLVFLGPWVSVDGKGRYRKGRWPFIGPFLAGMMQGRETVQLTMGGEFYSLELPRDYARAARRLRFDYPERWPFMNEDERTRWSREVRQAFAVYDRVWLSSDEGGPPLAPEPLFTKLEGALRNSQRIAWFYSEHYNWWPGLKSNTKEEVTPEILATMRRAYKSVK